MPSLRYIVTGPPLSLIQPQCVRKIEGIRYTNNNLQRKKLEFNSKVFYNTALYRSTLSFIGTNSVITQLGYLMKKQARNDNYSLRYEKEI